MEISVVIIARNEAHIIGNTLRSLSELTDDIVIADSGSTDGTRELCTQLGARVIPITWNGYGHAKNAGNAAARYPWILSLDADEAIDPELKQTLMQMAQPDEDSVFNLRFRNFLCGKEIRHGEWGRDEHIRMFNKNLVKWNDEGVHEGLLFPPHIRVRTLPGLVLHYTADNLLEYADKTTGYARLNAQKYFAIGKKTGPLKKYLSSLFSFIQNYLLRLGFLDGKAGLWIARNTARYTFLKYAELEKLHKNTQQY